MSSNELKWCDEIWSQVSESLKKHRGASLHCIMAFTHRAPLKTQLHCTLWALIFYLFMIQQCIPSALNSTNLMYCMTHVHCSSFSGPSGIKCIIYASLLFVALCIQDEWRGRWNAILWWRAQGNEKYAQTGPVLTHTHTHSYFMAPLPNPLPSSSRFEGDM